MSWLHAAPLSRQRISTKPQIPTAGHNQISKGLKRSIYLRAMFLVLGTTTLLVTARQSLVRIPALPQNLFSAYADLFPGQSKATLVAHGYACLEIDGAYQLAHCSYQPPPDGPIVNIAAVVRNYRVEQIIFTLRENVLRIGDLVLLWGQPDIRLGPHTALSWDNMGVIAVADHSSNRRLNYQLSVSRILLMQDTSMAYIQPVG